MNRDSRSTASNNNTRPGRNLRLALFVIPALIIFAVTWISITSSRSDSMALLIANGKSFTAALAQASENAIKSENVYDRLVQARYYDLASTLAEADLTRLSELELLRFNQVHDLYGTYIYGIDSGLVVSTAARGTSWELPDFVIEEMQGLIADPEERFVLLLDNNDNGNAIHYYLELANQLDRVVVLVIDANYYVTAEEEIGIGFLSQAMAREPGVEYILYQDPDGLIFASREPGSVLAIESDTFLQIALEADTVVSREVYFQSQEVLEFVLPFATDDYPSGLFRVGLSLDNYYAISRGFDSQMILLSSILSLLLVLVVFYVNSRDKRQELSRRYDRIKSVTDKIFEQMNTGVAVVDSSHQIRMTNQAFDRIFRVNDPIGMRLTAILDSSIFDLRTLKPVPAGEVVDVELKIRHEGKEQHLLVAISSIANDGGDESDQSSTLLVIYDITKLRQAEQSAARKERLSEMGDLAAGVAHEIRNPLNTISIAIQRLAKEFVPTDQSEEFLSFTSKIRSETRRLNDIITRFLALARDQVPRQKTIALDRLLAESFALLKDEAETIGINCQLLASTACEIKADPDELKQVFLNLFNNAKEAIDGKPGEIEIRLSCESGFAMIEFADSGPGVAETIRTDVFTPYFTTKETGTGLGLPTVYRIITNLGGDVVIDQSRWGGALIRLKIPLHSQTV